MSAIKLLYSLWNCDLTDLSKPNKIDCVKKITGLVLKTILSRCDEDNHAYWCELFEAVELLVVHIIDKNPEGRCCMLFPSDKHMFQLINQINTIQKNEEEHRAYILARKQRKPKYNSQRTKERRKRSKSLSDSDSSSESDCD
jgi:hypothetical protein